MTWRWTTLTTTTLTTTPVALLARKEMPRIHLTLQTTACQAERVKWILGNKDHELAYRPILYNDFIHPLFSNGHFMCFNFKICGIINTV